MLRSAKDISLESLKLASLNLISERYTNSNALELQKIKNLIDRQKMKGHKYPLLACIFLLFLEAGKNTLTKSELYSLMEKVSLRDKNKIISSPTERYCIINPSNYKAKIKDIIKKKKWFTKKMNNDGEIEYTLNEGSVCTVTPKIISYLNIIEKREYIFQSKGKEFMDGMDYNSKKEKGEIKIKEEDMDEDDPSSNEEKPIKETKEIKDAKEFLRKGNDNDITVFRDFEKPKKLKENKQVNEMKKLYDLKIQKNEQNIQKIIERLKKEKILSKDFSNIFEKNEKKENNENKENKAEEDYDIIIEDDKPRKIYESLKKKLEKEKAKRMGMEFDDEEKSSSSDEQPENIISTNPYMDNLNNNLSNDYFLNLANKYLNKKRNPSKPKSKIISSKNINIKKNINLNSLGESDLLFSGDLQRKNAQKRIEELNKLKEKRELKLKIEERKNNILFNKMSSIINIGEIFLNLLNSNGLFQLTSKKKSTIKKKIEKKEKEIQTSKLILEKLIESEEKVKYLNSKEIEEILNTTKLNYKEYKDKIDILLMYKEIIDKTENKEDIKNVLTNYYKVFEKCTEILGRMMGNISLIFNDYVNLDEYVNVLLDEEKDSWVKENIGINRKEFKKQNLNIKKLEDLGNLFRKELENTMLNDKIDIKDVQLSETKNGESAAELKNSDKIKTEDDATEENKNDETTNEDNIKKDNTVEENNYSEANDIKKEDNKIEENVWKNYVEDNNIWEEKKDSINPENKEEENKIMEKVEVNGFGENKNEDNKIEQTIIEKDKLEKNIIEEIQNKTGVESKLENNIITDNNNKIEDNIISENKIDECKPEDMNINEYNKNDNYENDDNRIKDIKMDDNKDEENKIENNNKNENNKIDENIFEDNKTEDKRFQEEQNKIEVNKMQEKGIDENKKEENEENKEEGKEEKKIGENIVEQKPMEDNKIEEKNKMEIDDDNANKEKTINDMKNVEENKINENKIEEKKEIDESKNEENKIETKKDENEFKQININFDNNNQALNTDINYNIVNNNSKNDDNKENIDPQKRN